MMQVFNHNNIVNCLHPQTVKNKFTGELISVPCGKCSLCAARSSQLWTSRLCEESTCHTYTLFGTLTYSDSHLPRFDVSKLEVSDDKISKILESSKDFIDYNQGFVPCFNVSDIQKFFKKLRYYIVKNHGTQTHIRYFIVGDVGLTTYRPHYHFLLWFDSPDLVSTIKSYIFESWKSQTDFKELRPFLRRNKLRFVHGYAESYVAGYVNKNSHLPAIFSLKPFKPFHCQSSNPPIGTIRIFKEAMESLISGNVNQVTLHRLSTGESVVCPLWSGLENRLFPKCLRFSSLSLRDRIALYEIFSTSYFETQRDDFESFKKWFLSERSAFLPCVQLFRRFCPSNEEDDASSFFRSLRRTWNISRQFRQLRMSFGLHVSAYVERIDTYYSRKEYLSLHSQLEFEEKVSVSPRFDVDIRYLPYLIDSQFYNNERNIKSYSSYLEQFGLSQVDPCFFVPQFSLAWLEKKSYYDERLRRYEQKKVKKDYVANHPDCFRNYVASLTPFIV